MDSNSRNEDQKESWYGRVAAKVPLPDHGDDDRGVLFVGQRSAAECLQFIQDCKITHILTIAAGVDVTVPKVALRPAAKHLVVKCRDEPMANILEVLPQCLNFVHEGLQSQSSLDSSAKGGRGSVLVHCVAGISRSVTVCTAYIMMMHHSRRQNVKASDVIISIGSVRQYANPNIGFRRQLDILERHLTKDNAEFDKGGGSVRGEEEAGDQCMERFSAIIKSAQKEHTKVHSNFVEDTICQRATVNELYAKVDVQENKLASMKPRITASQMDAGDDDDNTTSNADDDDENGGGERGNIQHALLLLQAELDSCLPMEGEGLVDPPARMIRKAAVVKINRLLKTLSA
mmetsp:Transcript_12276/g.17865  ORF Transcript_12276/g.17865 Transcript_12276/m.17865 type:complete len:345 (+) Transcript_12276:79-1113(+)|eukprot:CAMPEP_0197233664 /NCGR_PEP_ID=MMETSP1429-20130617/1674_1 /TAXON_ID=49237 /ORGANISM="Chaetoceros  sp., Strain UNC1202" /LENGTH=344 /DNA_ID=CAMNT_0042691961 /DNA_START=79 /DNA_END=1113 /DNA_ORIENTATION=+